MPNLTDAEREVIYASFGRSDETEPALERRAPDPLLVDISRKLDSHITEATAFYRRAEPALKAYEAVAGAGETLGYGAKLAGRITKIVAFAGLAWALLGHKWHDAMRWAGIE